jgi:hypothetical protein
VEGVTFRDSEVAMQLKDRFVESRLHMDGFNRVPEMLFDKHVTLRDELIGNPAMPFYAIVDPKTDEFLFRTNLRGSDPAGWKKDFLAMFAKLPDLKDG